MSDEVAALSVTLNARSNAVSQPELEVRELRDSVPARTFIELLTRELPAHYDEVDESFAAGIFRIAGLERDPDGYFTVRKRIFTGHIDGTAFGLTVATFKRGGSVKIGPTAVLPQYRRQGLASALRDAVERRLFEFEGARKLYMTIAASNLAALRFNLQRGFQVEGVLRGQYAAGRDELVLGRFAESHSTTPPVSITSPLDWRTGSNSWSAGTWPDPAESQVRTYLEPLLAPLFDDLDASFFRNMVAACAPDRQHYSRKGKSLIVCRGGDGTIGGVAVFVPKRGGAAKLSPLIADNEQALRLLVTESIGHAQAAGRRKLYAHVPLPLDHVTDVLHSMGFVLEAQLREPYKAGVDVLVLGYTF